MSDSEPQNAGEPRVQRGKPLPVIFGLARTELNPLERSFFADVNPFGFILFKRNCQTPDQVRWLVKELRQTIGRDDAPILIDQEGGRVARLQPPHWPKQPPAHVFGLMYEKDQSLGTEALQIYVRIVTNELAKLGINVNCAPVVDLFIEGATSALGDRAMSRKPAIVAELSRLWAEVSLENGVLPVIKHFPGHGRMKTDPHDMLPVIEASRAELETEDFVPFELLKDLPLGMTSHAVFMALDETTPASLSSRVHRDIIRGSMGFDGLLLSDDLTMKALHGLPGDLARRAIKAGSDIALHCNGDLQEMAAVAHALEPISGESWARWNYAQTMVKPVNLAYKPAEDLDRLDILLGASAFTDKSIG